MVWRFLLFYSSNFMKTKCFHQMELQNEQTSCSEPITNPGEVANQHRAQLSQLTIETNVLSQFQG